MRHFYWAHAQRLIGKHAAPEERKPQLSTAENDKPDGEDKTPEEQGLSSWRYEAYMMEAEEVPRLLSELCCTLDEPPHTSRGPIPLPLGDQIQCMVLKVFFRCSAARVVGHLEEAREKGRITRVPMPSSIVNYYNSTGVT